jgi:hypothetical protein
MRQVLLGVSLAAQVRQSCCTVQAHHTPICSHPSSQPRLGHAAVRRPGIDNHDTALRGPGVRKERTTHPTQAALPHAEKTYMSCTAAQQQFPAKTATLQRASMRQQCCFVTRRPPAGLLPCLHAPATNSAQCALHPPPLWSGLISL